MLSLIREEEVKREGMSVLIDLRRVDARRLGSAFANEWSGPIFIYSLRWGSEQAFTSILVTLSVSDARVTYLSLLTIYTSHSVKVFPMQFVRARALEYDVNIGRGTP